MKVYKEVQRFDQWWIRVLLLAVIAVAISPFILHYDTLINSRFELMSVIISILIILTVFLAFWFLFKLETQIDENGISYRFYPFQRRFRFSSWADMQQVTIRTYNPILEYGGWGYRISLHKKKALNIKGKIGIQIVFKNGKELLLGTQNPDAVNEMINKYHIK